MRVLPWGLPTSAFVVGALVLVAASLAGYYAVRATSWAVMTDELQVARLATSIAHGLSPIPEIHGRYYGALSQLYPLLLAPFYGALSAPAAQTAAHASNAILLASAAVPAYLLARSVTGSRGAGFVAAALVAFTPWLALASTILTENAAYPAFTWSVYLCHRTLASPSRGRDVAALAGLLLAFFARTQLFVLAAALPVALLIHEIAFAVSARGGSTRRSALRTGAKEAVARHGVLAGAYVVGLLGSVALVANGSLGALVGNYATPFHGDLLPGGFWHSAAAHLDQVAVGAGIVPLPLAASWAFVAFVRPRLKEAHAFAALLLVLVPLLTLEVTSFDLRFTPEEFIQDRYLFYLVPLLAVGSAAWLVQRTEWTLRSISLLVSGALVALLLSAAVYDDRTIIFWASPAAAFHPAIADAAAALRLSARLFLPLAGLTLVVVLAVAALLAPRATMVVTGFAVAAFGASQAGYVLHRYAEPVMTRPASAPTRDWIDRATRGRSVALVPSPRDAPGPWWEAELWNEDVDRVLRVGSGTTFSPFPTDRVSVDYAAGRLRGPAPSANLVVSDGETRFHLLGARTIVDAGPIRLVRVRRPYRLSWATRGLTPDGWTRPLGLTAVRLYGRGDRVRRAVVLTLAAPVSARKPVNFYLRSGDLLVQGSVDPGGARPPVRMVVCVPAHGFADVTMVTSGGSRIADGRHVGLHLDRLRVRSASRCDAPTGLTAG